MPDSEQEAEIIRNLIEGVAPALTLLAGMELKVFTAIGDKGATAAEIAKATGTDENRVSRLLYALVVAGVLKVHDGRFSNCPEGERLLVEGRPDYMGSAFELYTKLWRADLNTAASIRQKTPKAEHDFLSATPEEAAAFLRGSMSSALTFGRAIARYFDLSKCRSAIDIGGGAGGVLVGLRECMPELQTTLFELPRVLFHAESLLDGLLPQGAVTLEAGDITAAPPNGTYDIAILRAVVQVLSRDDAARAIANAAEALEHGGQLFISGWGILDNDRLGPRSGVFVNLSFLNLYRAGESYTEEEYRMWMRDAGLAYIERTRLPDGTEIIRGVRAS